MASATATDTDASVKLRVIRDLIATIEEAIDRLDDVYHTSQDEAMRDSLPDPLEGEVKASAANAEQAKSCLEDQLAEIEQGLI